MTESTWAVGTESLDCSVNATPDKRPQNSPRLSEAWPAGPVQVKNWTAPPSDATGFAGEENSSQRDDCTPARAEVSLQPSCTHPSPPARCLPT